MTNQVANGCSVLKNWGIHSIAESSTVHEVYICGAERRNTGRVGIFRVFCRAARPSMQTLCWEESDSRIPDCCGYGKDRGARGAVQSIIMAYAITSYVGMTLKKMAATLKVHK